MEKTSVEQVLRFAGRSEVPLPKMLMRDEILVVKPDGTRSDPLPANVSKDAIMFESPQVPVEDGDTIIRLLPKGAEEEYLVLDSGFQRAVLSFPDHYQTKVRKKSAVYDRPAAQTVYNVSVSGTNARFNLDSVDTSTNVVEVAPEQLFDDLKETLRDNVEDELRRRILLDKVAAMQEAQGSSLFTERYKDFISSAADYVTLLTPFITGLSQLL
jgi:hypothetical protein